MQGIHWALLLLPAMLWGYFTLNDGIWWIENIIGYPALFAVGYSLWCLIMLMIKHWLKAGICALLVGCFLLLSPSQSRDLFARCDNPLSIIQYNLFYSNPNLNQLITYLIQNPADLVVLQEVSPSVGERLQTLTDIYPYYYGGQPGVGYPSSQMILSRFPLEQASVYTTPDQQHVIFSTWQAGKQSPLLLVSAHPVSPRSEELWHRRNAILATIESLLDQYESREVLVVGDFNLSARSLRFMRLFSGFQTAPVASWPIWAQKMETPSWSMVAIDHLWLRSTQGTRKICTRHSQAVPRGSDHRMVVTKIGY
ncbi:endonuclease/exonuclease/phosphatase family protein [Vibrio sp. LaRot3]|nr:endonuclease/exonuclease/phosphatase family protein [Vibrio sp. LaRot3]MDA0150229.1 endonuclease/exonuclease/phosphatase family protein [Vibrio sp. LaRot3]